jgi:hypothetical protein
MACGDREPATPQPPPTLGETPQAAPETAAPGTAVPAPEEGDGRVPDVVTTEGSIPEGFPKDVPVYPGSEIGSSMTTPGLGVFSTFESDDPVDTIVSHYRSELTKSGWSVVDSPDGDGVDGTKDKRTVQVRARKNPDKGTEIAIHVTG